ncbi:MAG: hypothetical protein IKP40_01075 [Clostridia bacterium]|nr:hypothetical protein [Clostridia bacterium]
MKFRLCPRCELNYITEQERYCKVCLQDMHGESRGEETELCSICNEAPALPGRDVCALCLKEMNGQGERDADDADGDQQLGQSIGMDSVAQMDEIIPEMEESQEFGEMSNALSLESVREDEEKRQDEEEAEEADEDA